MMHATMQLARPRSRLEERRVIKGRRGHFGHIEQGRPCSITYRATVTYLTLTP